MPDSDDRRDTESLMVWGRILEEYAVDWDKTFGHRAPDYFTQEYWYLFVRCTFAMLQGEPLTVTSASQSMKSGSNRTRETRIQRAVIDGYLKKERSQDDAREVFLLPTDNLKEMILGHLDRTLSVALEQLKDIK